MRCAPVTPSRDNQNVWVYALNESGHAPSSAYIPIGSWLDVPLSGDECSPVASCQNLNFFVGFLIFGAIFDMGVLQGGGERASTLIIMNRKSVRRRPCVQSAQ